MRRSRQRSTTSISTTARARSMPATIDLEELGLDRGGHLLLERALNRLPLGGELVVAGRDPALAIHLRTWARAQGHELRDGSVLVRGAASNQRWIGAERAGGYTPSEVVNHPAATWGVAARGALIEGGG